VKSQEVGRPHCGQRHLQYPRSSITCRAVTAPRPHLMANKCRRRRSFIARFGSRDTVPPDAPPDRCSIGRSSRAGCAVLQPVWNARCTAVAVRRNRCPIAHAGFVRRTCVLKKLVGTRAIRQSTTVHRELRDGSMCSSPPRMRTRSSSACATRRRPNASPSIRQWRHETRLPVARAPESR
jgi:hypothetical protein